MSMDRATEIIAHFIGVFEVAAEEGRIRHGYRDFDADAAPGDTLPPMDAIPISFATSYNFLGFYPGVPYEPLGWTVETVWSPSLAMELRGIRPVGLERFRTGAERPDGLTLPGPNRFDAAPGMTVSPPGEVAAIIVQTIAQSDEDYLSLGDHGLAFHMGREPKAVLDDFGGAALKLSPLGDMPIAGSSATIIATIENAAARLAGFDPAAVPGARIVVVEGESLEGVYFNGVLVEDAPDFAIYRPLAETAPEPESQPASIRKGGEGEGGSLAKGGPAVDGAYASEASITLQTGGNRLVNAVELSNEWLHGPVFAVAGNHVELNAIIQINAWQDSDRIGTAVEGWVLDKDDPTLGLNIGMFSRIDAREQTTIPSDASGFPQTWAVTEITGDLVILNWIEQFSYMLDNDIAILSAFGAKATVILGDNTASNAVTLEEIGFNYDLIVIGGNIYDANLIQQTNVLVDSDLAGAVPGFSTTGTGAASMAGNLLWNQAHIVQVGDPGRFEAMPQHYLEAVQNLRTGRMEMPDAVLQDNAFYGLPGLRVLYVSGDFLNLQYVKQTNILGDSDQIALAMGRLQARPDADWTLSTGANTLVNVAGIVDVDGTGKTYVGGEVYSDEILIQAEFLPSDPWLSMRDPNALVSEAVVFLGDDMLDGPDGFDTLPYGASHIQAPHPDVMHTMLA